MLDRDELIPEEQQEQNQPLIHDLGRLYETRNEDSASLERIRAHLLQEIAPSLPLTSERQTVRSLPGGRGHANTPRRLRLFHMVMAATLLMAIIASFLILFPRHSNIGIVMLGNRPPGLTHGWSLVARLSGTGNQEITGLNIESGQKYGLALSCSDTSGVISIAVNGEIVAGTSCPVTLTEPPMPMFSRSSPKFLPPIHTIEVEQAPASLSWEILIFQGTYHPPLRVDTANYHPLADEVDGTGTTLQGGFEAPLPKTWGFKYVCYGTGHIKISFWNNAQLIFTAAGSPCNGQTEFDLSSASGSRETVSQIQVSTDAGNDWQILIVGCTNNKAFCGTGDGTPDPTP